MSAGRLAVLLALVPLSALADISARFTESAPKDRFGFVNEGCPLGPVTLTLDLTGASGGLIFDISASGAGVDVFQPFEVTSNPARLVRATRLRDGDQVLTVELSGLDSGEAFTFTIDLDDTRRQSDLGQTRVSGSEIAGAMLRVAVPEREVTAAAVFRANGTAYAALPDCLS